MVKKLRRNAFHISNETFLLADNGNNDGQRSYEGSSEQESNEVVEALNFKQ